MRAPVRGEVTVTSPTTRVQARPRATPQYRAYPVQVVRAVRLSPHFVRLTFGAPQLAEFGYAGNDQRVKVLLPQPGRSLADLPTGEDWYLRCRQLPDHVRPTMRTYTVRAFRPQDHEVDVDFVLHGMNDDDQPGPLSMWAATAGPGDEVALLGPDRPGSGRLWGAEWNPPPATGRVLIAGDETAVPAMGAILEGMPAHLSGVVLAEVPTIADIPAWHTRPGVDVRWLVRARCDTHVARGELLEEAVTTALSASCDRRAPLAAVPWAEDDDDGALLWDVPEYPSDRSGDLYVWMAGEAGVMKRLRRLARHDHGLSKSTVACMGYWRRGASESH